VIGFRSPTRRFARLKQALFRGRRPGRLCFTVGNTVRLFKSGEAFFPALIGRIDAAQREISLETYIFNDDAAGRPISDALMNAARRGVKVRVITDGVGTDRLPMFEEWPKAGIEHRIYNPHLFGQLGFSRTHRKLVVCVKPSICSGRGSGSASSRARLVRRARIRSHSRTRTPARKAAFAVTPGRGCERDAARFMPSTSPVWRSSPATTWSTGAR